MNIKHSLVAASVLAVTTAGAATAAASSTSPRTSPPCARATPTPQSSRPATWSARGGCHPIDGCLDGDDYAGAEFRFLAANVKWKRSGEPVFPAYKTKAFNGVQVAFIGMTLEGTPSIVSPSGIAQLEFADEADTVNALIPELRQRGVEAIVVVVHEGGTQAAPAPYNGCTGISGPIVDIVSRLDDAVNVVITMTLTGGQVEQLLEQQFVGCGQAINRILQVSAGLEYAWSASGPACDKVDPQSIRVNGAMVVPAASYRDTVNSFLADGGDNFAVLP